ncbi:MAG: hypothetical protein JSU01_01470 [Bacteroidetes bacterium]|nr:hypothetical protein [Bacteroidota bacterium]
MESFTFYDYLREILIGLTVSATAGFIAFAINRRYLKSSTTRLYKSITGKWVSYAFISDNSFDKNKKIGEIEISIIEDYVLHLYYKEVLHPHEWEGEIFMNKEFPRIGRICWRYVVLRGDQTNSTLNSGFKDFVIERNDKYNIMLRLVGEHDKGFYDELLIRKYID